MKKWQLPFLLLLIIGTIYIVRQQRNMPYQKNSGFIFGTVYNVTYQSDRDLQQEIEAELKKVDAEFSMFNDKSTVSQLNRGEQPKLSPQFCEVFKLARHISEQTDGAFDITVAPLVTRGASASSTSRCLQRNRWTACASSSVTRTSRSTERPLSSRRRA